MVRDLERCKFDPLSIPDAGDIPRSETFYAAILCISESRDRLKLLDISPSRDNNKFTYETLYADRKLSINDRAAGISFKPSLPHATPMGHAFGMQSYQHPYTSEEPAAIFSSNLRPSEIRTF